jgi:hypothetical protein
MVPTSPKKRRSRVVLEELVVRAKSASERAQAEFNLAVFHDNNSREAEAIPHYRAALGLGLSGDTKAQCLAWLASSLYKTGSATDALQCVESSRELALDAKLIRFLYGLEKRIRLKTPLAERRRGGSHAVRDYR